MCTYLNYRSQLASVVWAEWRPTNKPRDYRRQKARRVRARRRKIIDKSKITWRITDASVRDAFIHRVLYRTRNHRTTKWRTKSTTTSYPWKYRKTEGNSNPKVHGSNKTNRASTLIARIQKVHCGCPLSFSSFISSNIYSEVHSYGYVLDSRACVAQVKNASQAVRKCTWYRIRIHRRENPRRRYFRWRL